MVEYENSSTIKKIWGLSAKADLKRIYKFNKEIVSKDFAIKVQNEILEIVNSITFSEQYQVDDILKAPYRRIVIRHYKIVYRLKDKDILAILMVFDSREDPIKYKLIE